MTAVLAVFFAFTACDDEFTEIGGEIINNPTDVDLMEVEVNAYSSKINSIQTNNLSNLFLGVNKNPVYGESTASIVSQLSLSRTNPEFGENVELDSVVMTLPYYSSEDQNSTAEEAEFVLDSVFGGGSFNLAIYETNYFLSDYDPEQGFQERQKYYSDQQGVIEQNIIGEALYTEEDFEPSAATYTAYELTSDGDIDTLVKVPALRVKLPNEYFKEKIIAKEGSDELFNNNNFKNYFRSIFVKAEANESEGVQILFDMNNQNAKITLYYTEEDEEGERTRDSFSLNFASTQSTSVNRFNTYQGEFPEDVLQKIEAQQEGSGGSENLYLKSQEGSMAVINLFPDETVLEQLREEERLVNEANLIFYVDQDKLNGSIEPDRLFLYDIENNVSLVDYQNDPTANESVPRLSRTTFSAPLEKGEDENGIFYKVKITQHLANILNGDTENVDLGVVITGNINLPGLSGVRQMENVERVPSSTLLLPFGTVLHGDESADEEKRLKLRIYYTDY